MKKETTKHGSSDWKQHSDGAQDWETEHIASYRCKRCIYLYNFSACNQVENEGFESCSITRWQTLGQAR